MAADCNWMADSSGAYDCATFLCCVMLLSIRMRERQSCTDDVNASHVTTLHLHPCLQVHSVFGRLKPGSIEAPQHLSNNGIDVLGIQPAHKNQRSENGRLMQHNSAQSLRR